MDPEVHGDDPWHADEDDDCVRIFRGHLQIIKAPKHGTPYAEYWPDTEMLAWILRALNKAESDGEFVPAWHR